MFMRINTDDEREYEASVIEVQESDKGAELDTSEAERQTMTVLESPPGSFIRDRSSSIEIIEKPSPRRLSNTQRQTGITDARVSATAQQKSNIDSRPARAARAGPFDGPTTRRPRMLAARVQPQSTDTRCRDSAATDRTTAVKPALTRTGSRQIPVVELRSWSAEQLQLYPLYDPTLSASNSRLHSTPMRPMARLSTSQNTETSGSALDEIEQALSSTENPMQVQETDFMQIIERAESDDDIPLTLANRPHRSGPRSCVSPAAGQSDDSQPVGRRMGKDKHKKVENSTSPKLSSSKKHNNPGSIVVDDTDELESRLIPPLVKTPRNKAVPKTRKRSTVEKEESEASDDEPVARRPKSLNRKPPSETNSRRRSDLKGEARASIVGISRMSKLKSAARDPDESERATSDGEDDNDIQMEEMDRFKTASRLRKKTETAFQRNLRKAKNKRLGIVDSTSEGEEEYSEHSSMSRSQDEEEDDFIVEDRGQTGGVALPHEFSLDSAQTPEYKFKVVFHYMVLLVVRGSKALPLRGRDAQYFAPMLQDLRRLIQGYRDSRVRSQIWRAEFVQVLKRYPNFVVRHACRCAADI